MKNRSNLILSTLTFGSLFSVTALSQAQEEATHNVLPAIAHFEGVGSIAAVGVQSKNLGEADAALLAMMATGDAEGGLLSISELPWASGNLSFTTAFVNDITLDTQYGRGTSISTEYEQQLSGIAQFARFESDINTQQSWYTNLGLSLVSFEGYADSDGNQISINQSGLHDVFSTMATVGITHNDEPSELDNTHLKAGIELTALLFRPGQSEQAQLNYNTSYQIPLSHGFAVTGYIRASHGFVLAKATEYDEVSEVLAELDGQCTSAACSELENDLANYIVEGNKKGNAQALGGAYGLRSYSEQYVKGAHTLLEGLEVTMALPFAVGQGNSVELVAFAEAGQASDALADLADDSLYSVGAGARFNIQDLPIRLEAAVGSDDTEAWLLTAGKRW